MKSIEDRRQTDFNVVNEEMLFMHQLMTRRAVPLETITLSGDAASFYNQSHRPSRPLR
jgi:hypothetical protein